MFYNSAIPYIAGIYGEEKQLIQTAEEAAELAQAALKPSRRTKSKQYLH